MDVFEFFYILTSSQNTTIFDNIFFFPLYVFGFLVQNQVSICVQIYFWVFDLIPLIHLSIFMPIPCGFYYYSFVVEFEFRDGDTFRSSFIVLDCFGYPVHVFLCLLVFLLIFLYEFECCYFKAFKKLGYNFGGEFIGSEKCFCKIAIFTLQETNHNTKDKHHLRIKY